MKKILIGVLIFCFTLWLATAQDSNQDVVSWLYSNWLTKYSSAQDFRSYDSITRGEAAKFMVKYAETLKKTKVKKSSECEFSDIKNYDNSLVSYIIESCEYGIFKWSNGTYYPNNNITNGEAITVIMRLMYWTMNEKEIPWYQEYYQKAVSQNINLWNINSFDLPISRITRWSRLYQNDEFIVTSISNNFTISTPTDWIKTVGSEPNLLLTTHEAWQDPTNIMVYLYWNDYLRTIRDKRISINLEAWFDVPSESEVLLNGTKAIKLTFPSKSNDCTHIEYLHEINKNKIWVAAISGLCPSHSSGYDNAKISVAESINFQ